MTAINALRTSVSGLNAQATKLSGISNNIANSSTVGYKRVDTQFSSLVLYGTSNGASALAGTSATNRVAISSVGQLQATGVDTDIAVNGNGFLVVNENAGSNGKYLATRAGSFRPDAAGNLVNAAGYYLQGVKLGTDGLPVGTVGDNNMDSLTTVNINNISVASSPTTEMTFWANLPSGQTAYASPPPDIDSFVSNVDYYDALGGTQTLTYRFVPVVPENASDPSSYTWTVEIFDSATDSGTLAPVDPAKGATDPDRLVGRISLEFSNTGANAGTLKSVTDASGKYVTGLPLDTTAQVPDPSVHGQDSDSDGSPDVVAGIGTYDRTYGTLTLALGNGTANLPIKLGNLDSFEGITQLSGSFVPTKIEKNGSSFGLLERVSIEDDGKVIATFSNGQSRPIYELKLAVFPNPDGLNPINGDAYEMSRTAGAPRLLVAGEGAAGTTAGGALESSNVDIGTELTNLIETQRAYSSNATVVRTADQMLEEATNLKR